MGDRSTQGALACEWITLGQTWLESQEEDEAKRRKSRVRVEGEEVELVRFPA